MSIRTTWRAPPSSRPQGHDDRGPLVDTLRPFLLDGTIRSSAMTGSVLAVASAVTDRRTWFDGPGPVPEPVVDRMRAAVGVGRWNTRFGLYGPEEITAAQARIVGRACEAIPGVEVSLRTYPRSPVPAEVHPADRVMLGVPSTDMIRMASWSGGHPAHVDSRWSVRPRGAG